MSTAERSTPPPGPNRPDVDEDDLLTVPDRLVVGFLTITDPDQARKLKAPSANLHRPRPPGTRSGNGIYVVSPLANPRTPTIRRQAGGWPSGSVVDTSTGGRLSPQRDSTSARPRRGLEGELSDSRTSPGSTSPATPRTILQDAHGAAAPISRSRSSAQRRPGPPEALDFYAREHPRRSCSSTASPGPWSSTDWLTAASCSSASRPPNSPAALTGAVPPANLPAGPRRGPADDRGHPGRRRPDLANLNLGPSATRPIAPSFRISDREPRPCRPPGSR